MIGGESWVIVLKFFSKSLVVSSLNDVRKCQFQLSRVWKMRSYLCHADPFSSDPVKLLEIGHRRKASPCFIDMQFMKAKRQKFY